MSFSQYPLYKTLSGSVRARENHQSVWSILGIVVDLKGHGEAVYLETKKRGKVKKEIKTGPYSQENELLIRRSESLEKEYECTPYGVRFID